MTQQLKGQWNAAAFFEKLTATNRLAVAEGFTFCRVSGLEGFEEAVAQMQTAKAFVCISDINDGYTELNNTPRTRRIKNRVFRHAPCRRGHGRAGRVHGNNARIVPSIRLAANPRKGQVRAELHLPRPPNIVQRD